MASFANRLEAICEAVTATSKIIDINDQAEAKVALDITRGPCIGWDDYEAGRDYTPPYVYNTADVESVHNARTGKAVGIQTPAIPIGPKDNIGNPHSAKYGGVRPWSPDEVINCLMYLSNDRDLRGKLWSVINKGSVKRAFENSGQSFDPDRIENLARVAAWKSLLKDRNQIGTKFTSFIGSMVEEMITSGGSAGFGDEYKTARGILSRWEKSGRKAYTGLTAAAKGDTGGLQQAQTALAEISAEFNELDPHPGPGNRLGNLVTRLIQVGGDLTSAIRNRDTDRVAIATSYVKELYDDISEQEQEYRDRGPSTDTMITKSKTAAPIMVGPLAMKQKGSDEEIEVSNISTPGKLPGTQAYGTWAFKWKDDSGEHTKSVTDPESYLQTRTGIDHAQAAAKINERKPIPLKAVGNSPKGKLVFTPSNPGNDYTPGELSIRNDPKTMEMLTAFVQRARLGSGTGIGRHARAALDVIEKFQKVIEKIGQPTAKKNYTIRQKSDSYEIRSDRDGWWIDDGETFDTVAGPFFTERKAQDEYQKLMQTARDYEVVDTNSGEVLGSHEMPNDAKRQLDQLKANPLTVTVSNTIHSISSNDYGDFAVELIDIGKQLLGALRTNDSVAVEEIATDLEDLAAVARDDIGRGEDQQTVRPLTQQQYRIFLRLYGISEYPEKGTINDPEMQDDGSVSQWARMGYPPIEQNKAIADELGLSTTRVSQHRARINEIIPQMMEQMRKEDMDPIDCELLAELQKAFEQVFMEYIQMFGYKAVFG